MDEYCFSLDINRIRAALAGLEVGNDLLYYETVDSTNRLARDLRLGHGGAILADYQSVGRGRRGRRWEAPARSSLLLSLVLDVPDGASPIDMTAVAALSVLATIDGIVGETAELKWPNDVLLRGGKVCGILAERPSTETAMVIGIGINVNLRTNTTLADGTPLASLSLIAGRALSREEIAIALFRHINMWYRMLTESADSVHEAWVARLDIVGRALEVHDSESRWAGIAVGVQRDGALRVSDAFGHTRALYAADVSVRPPKAQSGPSDW